MVNHSGLTMCHSGVVQVLLLFLFLFYFYFYFKELAVLDLPCFTNVEKPLDNKGLQKEFLNGKNLRY
jgi:hypothetical protein